MTTQHFFIVFISVYIIHKTLWNKSEISYKSDRCDGKGSSHFLNMQPNGFRTGVGGKCGNNKWLDEGAAKGSHAESKIQQGHIMCNFITFTSKSCPGVQTATIQNAPL